MACGLTTCLVTRAWEEMAWTSSDWWTRQHLGRIPPDKSLRTKFERFGSSFHHEHVENNVKLIFLMLMHLVLISFFVFPIVRESILHFQWCIAGEARTQTLGIVLVWSLVCQTCVIEFSGEGLVCGHSLMVSPSANF